MRGCFLSLLLGLAGAVLSVAAVLAFLHYRQGVPLADAGGPSLFAGIFAWISLNLVRAALRSWREKKALQRGLTGEAPADGRPFVFVGTLEPLTTKILAAPFDGGPCLLYDYKITEVRGSGKSRSYITHYRGSALAPSAVATSSGTYPLLAVPDFEGEAPPLSSGDARQRFEKYAATTEFRSSKTSAKELEERWSDADGSYRSDISYTGHENPSLAAATFTQHRVEPGGKVCVIGHYAAGRGIVAHRSWGERTRILAGDTGKVARVLGSQVRTRLILATVFAAAAAGIVLLLVPAG